MRVIVRPPGKSFASGLTQAGLGAPDWDLARDQHAGYVSAIRDWGIDVFELPADDAYPDSTFVEDTAVVFGSSIVWCRPGADSRRGEVTAIRAQMPWKLEEAEIVAPGTVDGGDICAMGPRFAIGISERTNEEGARQFAALVSSAGYETTTIDVRGTRLLHLKTGLSYYDGTVVCLRELASLFSDPIVVDDDEKYAANGAWFGERRALLPAGAPKLASKLRGRGFDVKVVAMSEFRKMDGGVSCLSLRFIS